MKAHNGSWWGWLVAALVLLALVSDGDVPVLPLIIGFVILFNVLGRRRRVTTRPPARGEVPDAPGRGWPHPGAAGAGPAAPPQDSPMPTIDVPRYPGGGPVPGPFMPRPSSGPTGPVAPQGGAGPDGAANPYGAAPPDGAALPDGAVPAPMPPVGAPQTSTDPVVSLGQLHLSRCGRDLQSAIQHGTATEVARVLDETRDLSRRMQDMLGAAEGTPGSGRKEFAAGLRALDRLVEDARGEHPPGARLTRVTQTCLRMGQTGRHE